MVFTMVDFDILNCRIITLNKDRALDMLMTIAENDDSPGLWYKLVRFESNNLLREGDTVYIAARLSGDDCSKLEIHEIYDQYEMIPDQIRQNDLDYWIEDMELV